MPPGGGLQRHTLRHPFRAGAESVRLGCVRSLVLVIVGAVAVLLGGLWALQGSGVIGGSVMTDSTMWLVIGVVVVVVGAGLIVFGARKRV